MLFKLAFQNIKKEIKNYAIYFFTLVIGVTIFYMFSSLDSQQAMIKVSQAQQDLIRTLMLMLEVISAIVAIILGFLIVYANKFLISRRKKEFGIYMTLGMGKWNVSKIILLETIFVGIISLIAGLGLGIILSQFMSVLVAKLFVADMKEYQFIFSMSACIKTCLYFAVMYLVVILFNAITVSRYKLIDLLTAERKNEKIKIRNSFISIIVFIIGAIILGYAYWFVTGREINALNVGKELLKPILMGGIGTVLVVWSLSSFMTKIIKTNKNIYLKGTNLFVLRQLNNKINTNVISVSIICIMLFITITMLSSSIAMRNTTQRELNEVTPVDIMLYKDVVGLNEQEKNLEIKDNLLKSNFNMNLLKDIIEIPIYSTYDVALADFLGNDLERIKTEFPKLLFNKNEEIIKLSDYNKIAKLYGIQQYELNDDEYIMTCDFVNMIGVRNKALSDGIAPIKINGKEYKTKYDECQYGFVAMSTGYSNDGLIIVPDDTVLTADLKIRSLFVANYNYNSEEQKNEIEKIFTNKESEFMKNLSNKNTGIVLATKLELIEASIGVSTVVVFIAIYLGSIFLIASVAILALKQLTESSDNRERYSILRKIGCDEKMINETLFKQVAIFFLLPLVFAIIHSIFGIKFAIAIMSGMVSSEALLPSILATAILIGMIYVAYFIATYKGSKNVIKEKNINRTL